MTQPGKFYGWKLLAALWLILATNLAFPMYGGGVINAYMATELHFDRSTLGSGFGILQLMIGLPGPLLALCINKKGVGFTLRLGAFVSVIGALLMALFVHTSTQFLIVFGFIVGAGVVSAGPLPTQTNISRWFDRRRALAIALLLSGPSVGGLVAPVVLDHLIGHYQGNWRAAWWLIAGLSTLAFLLALFFVRENPSDLGQFPDGDSGPADPSGDDHSQHERRVFRTSDDWTFTEVVRTPAWWILLLASVGFSAGYTTFLAHGVLHLRGLGYTPAQAASSYSVLLFALLVGNLVVAALGDRIEPRFLWAAASAAYGVGMLLVLKASGPTGLVAYAVFLGIGFGMAFPTMMTLPANYFGQKVYPWVVGFMMIVATAAGFSGSYGSGYAFDHSGTYVRAFSLIAVLCFVGAVLALFMLPPARNTARSVAQS